MCETAEHPRDATCLQLPPVQTVLRKQVSGLLSAFGAVASDSKFCWRQTWPGTRREFVVERRRAETRSPFTYDFVIYLNNATTRDNEWAH